MYKLTFWLLIIGGLNWLLLGLFNWEIGYFLVDIASWLPRVIYVAVGLSAIYQLLRRS
ncbi:MAG: DUF378 domain-containing protein [Patescibacteria group bacterium]|mgnify:CR=1|nr:MAG: DUF378 domain-containing protein [Candidatus Paceibacterota bacterium]